MPERIAVLLTILLLVVSCVTQAHASDVYVTASLASVHMNRSHNYNEANYGVGLEVKFNQTFSVAAGYYRNSLYRDSFYAGYSTCMDIGLCLMTGLVTGYTAKPLPLALPAFMTERFNILIVPPRLKNNNPGVLTFQLKWKI